MRGAPARRRDLLAALAALFTVPNALRAQAGAPDLSARIAADFAAGRVGLVDGWVLAESEIRLLAVSRKSARR